MGRRAPEEVGRVRREGGECLAGRRGAGEDSGGPCTGAGVVGRRNVGSAGVSEEAAGQSSVPVCRRCGR